MSMLTIIVVPFFDDFGIIFMSKGHISNSSDRDRLIEGKIEQRKENRSPIIHTSQL